MLPTAHQKGKQNVCHIAMIVIPPHPKETVLEWDLSNRKQLEISFVTWHDSLLVL